VAEGSLREQLREAISSIERLRAENRGLQAENEGLLAQFGKLLEDNEHLRDAVARLEAQLQADSSTTGKPPSSDPIGPRKKRAERRAEARAEKRRAGKQPGARGANLERRRPDVVVEHTPACCEACGADLAGAQVVGKQVRQVIDLPPVVPVVADHISYRLRCNCGAETLAGFPAEARAPVCFGPEVRALASYSLARQHLPIERTAELLEDLLGVKVSTGWLCALQAEAAERLTPFLSWLKDRLVKEPVVYADETGTAVGTTKHWAHTLTTKLLTLIAVHPRRGIEALKDIGVLAVYAGTVVHDGYATYDLLTNAAHAQCNVHALRHLKSVGETEAFSAWTDKMTGVLMDAKVASEAAASAGRRGVDAGRAAKIRASYHQGLDEVFALLPVGPPPPRRARPRWSEPQRKAWNLATRLLAHADDFLRCLDDTRVGWDNNVSERALRMVKIHDKISGPFHSLAGAEAFAAERSYLQTAANHGQNLLGVLRQLFTTGPWFPGPVGSG
jgi:transposase